MKTKTAVLIATLITTPAFAQPAKSTMKAVVVHEFGGPEVLKYEDAPRPQPKDDEVLIRVMAAAVNPVDVFIREGRITRFPLIPGMDVAGGAGKKWKKKTKVVKNATPLAPLSFF